MEPYGKGMQSVLGYIRRTVCDYRMIEAGDHIAVGVSGGKDSVALLVGMGRLRNILGVPFQLTAITIDPGFGGVCTDYSLIESLCQQLGIPYVIKRSDLGEIIFTHRRESNPCSLCARMRRGMLHDMALANGCNKIALGHNRDDAVETFIMNLFYEGRIGCFQPVTYLSRKNITMIRPLVLMPEKDITYAVKRSGLPVVKSKCPVDGNTSREEIKNWLRGMERDHYRGLSKRIFGAIRRAGIDGW